MRALALGCAVLLASTSATADAGLHALFDCSDRDALDVPAGALEARLLAAPDFACRELRQRQGSAVECDAEQPLAIGGLPAREFGAASEADGTRRVRSVFRASDQRLRESTARRLGLAFAADGEGRWVARDPAQPRHRVEVLAREDGSSILRCVRDPPRDEAGDLALGVDAERGAIAGRVAWPDGSRPALRVCAVPRVAILQARCVDRPAGRDDYLVAGLAPGDYDVVAFAMVDGAARHAVAAHASALEDCAPDATGCASGLLVPVTVRAGAVATDIDADRTFTQLPARFDEVRPR